MIFIFKGDEDHEVAQYESPAVPRAGEKFKYWSKDAEVIAEATVERVEWHLIEGRGGALTIQAHVYIPA